MMFIFVITTCNGCVVKDIISNISAKFYNPNIWEYGEGQWICEELNLEFTDISYESQEEAESTAGTIVKDGEVIDIKLRTRPSKLYTSTHELNETEVKVLSTIRKIIRENK